MKLLPHIDIKTKERPFSAPYASKARILTHSHLERYRSLPQNTLQIGIYMALRSGIGKGSSILLHCIFTIDQYALLKCCPQLIQEIMNLLGQVWYLGKNKRGVVKRERERERKRKEGREGERERVLIFPPTHRYCSLIGDI